VLQSYFETGSGSSPRHFCIFVLIPFLEEAFITSVIIIGKGKVTRNRLESPEGGVEVQLYTLLLSALEGGG
jgi:hypothetical protein